MNHIMTEKYFGDSVQSGAMGQFIEGKECILTGTCDRLSLYVVEKQQIIKVKEKRVFGYILGIEAVKEGGKTKNTDGAIVHFEHARTSTFFFDEKENEFVSTILRHYEKQEYGFVHTAERTPSILRVDSQHKIAFLLISKTHFALFSVDEVGKSKVIEVNTIRPRHCILKDVMFLKGFSSSTICFLFEDTTGDRCRASVYVIEEEEKELSLFFEIEAMPYGCYSIVPMQDKVFMILGVNGAIFYTQWEMVGVRFNNFWNMEAMGIKEIPIKIPSFSVDGGKCISYGQNVFLFGEEVTFRFTILGTEGRVHTIITDKIEIHESFSMGEPILCRAEKEKVFYVCTGGMHLMSVEKEQIVLEQNIQTEGNFLTQEFKDTFLETLKEVEEDKQALVSGGSLDVSEEKRRKAEAFVFSDLSPEEEKIYNEMFSSAHEEHSLVEQPVFSSDLSAYKLIMYAFSPLIGKIHCLEPITYTDKKKEYVASCGSLLAPLLMEIKEELELTFTKTARIKGYIGMFSVDPVQKMYLIVKEKESSIVVWGECIEPVSSEIEENERTIGWFLLSKAYAQVTCSSVIYLNRALKREKKISPAEKIVSALSLKESLVLLTESGNVFIYTNARKKKLPLVSIKSISLYQNRLFCINSNGALIIYSLSTSKVVFQSEQFTLFPFVAENKIGQTETPSSTKTAGVASPITEILVADRECAVYLILQTIHNEVVVYKEGKERFVKERVPNSTFYYEREKIQEKGRRKMQACKDLIVVPGRLCTRILTLTPNGVYLHVSFTPIESIIEMPYSKKRTFTVLAKGNIAEGTLPQYSYDKSVLYKTIPVESFCEKIAYCSKRKILIASTFREIDYTKEMVPFTVLSTTEVDAPPAAMPEVLDVEIRPKNRAYSLKLFSLEEMKNIRNGEVLLSVDSFPLETNEYIAHHRIMALPDKQSTEGLSIFVVVCTTYVTDEDLISTGRLMVFEVASVVPERNRKETKHKLKLLAAEKTKGAAIACEQICGSIAVCLGTKLMVYAFERNEGLKAVAFHDMQVFLVSCSVLRNILVCADAYKGLFFFFFQSEPPLLHLLSQSMVTVDLLRGVSMSLHKEACGIISYDSSRNVYIHSYSPQNILSQKGTRLVIRAECRLPDTISGSFCTEVEKDYKVVLYTQNGYIYRHSMIEQNRYASLLDLQSSIISQICLTLGTNPLAHWIAEKPAEMKEITLKEVVQSGISEEYFEMERTRQKRVSSAVGRSSLDAVKAEIILFYK